MQLAESMKGYDDSDELPPINGGVKMKPSKYALPKQLPHNTKPSNGQGSSLYSSGGVGASATFKPPKSIVAPAAGSNGSHTNRSGVLQDATMAAGAGAKSSKKASGGASSTMTQLPLKKVTNAVASKPKKYTGSAIPSSLGIGSSSSSSFGDVSLGGGALRSLGR